MAGKLPLPQRRFTVHHKLFTQRSEFFRAARSPQWLTDPTKPVDLEDDDPEVVSKYLSCVYFGVEEALKTDILDQELVTSYSGVDDNVLEDACNWSQQECVKHEAEIMEEVGQSAYDISCNAHHFFLAKVYLQADKLQDPKTANSVADEIIRFSQASGRNPSVQAINHVYESTVQGSPLRKLMRDFKVHMTFSDAYLEFYAVDYHEDVCRDIAVEFLRAKDETRGTRMRHPGCMEDPGFPQILCADKHAYHLRSGPMNPKRRAGSCACVNSRNRYHACRSPDGRSQY